MEPDQQRQVEPEQQLRSTTSHVTTRLWHGRRQALLHDHSPETIVWHVGNVTAALSSSEVQTTLNMPDVVIHCFSSSHGSITIENAGHCTTSHRFVVTSTGKPIKLTMYNSYVLLTLPLGEWADDVSWRRADRAATDVLLNHPGCVNTNHWWREEGDLWNRYRISSPKVQNGHEQGLRSTSSHFRDPSNFCPWLSGFDPQRHTLYLHISYIYICILKCRRHRE